MDFSLSAEQQGICDSVARICAGFDDAYWLERDTEGGFPQRFFDAIAADGWLGICIPEAYGGSGLGITEAALMTGAIAQSGAGMSGASAVHMNIFGLNPVVQFGSEGEMAILEFVGTALVKRAAERAKRREERLQALREGKETEE